MAQTGENIRYFRKKENWTQQHLADQINISRSVLTRWETGQLVPDLQALLKLCQVFDVSLDSLTGHQTARETLLLEARELYHLEHDTLDKQTLEILLYLQQYPELKTGLYRLATAAHTKRRPYEKILNHLLHDLLSD